MTPVPLVKLLVLLVPALLVSCDSPPKAQASDDRPRTSFDGNAALGYVKTQLDFGPRVPGSPGARKTGDWIIDKLRPLADTLIIQEWTHVAAGGKKLPMRNILARFRAADSARVLYLTHWDTRPISDGAMIPDELSQPVPGANDGASGTALLLALADAFARTPPTVGVDLLFVDGEDYGDFDAMKDVLIGSTYFADHLPTPDYRPLYGVLWDMIGDKNLELRHEGHSVEQAPEVVSRVWQKASELGYSSTFVPRGQRGVTDDHLPLLKKGLRVIDVIDLDYEPHHRPSDTFDKVSARSLQIVGDVALSLVTEP